MPDKVQLNESLGIIECQSYGEVTVADIAGSIAQARQIQSQTGINRMLVDTTRQQSLPSTIEMLEIFSRYPRDLKTALVVDASQVTADDVEFVETVGVNRGKNMRLHFDRERALRWLNS